MGADDAGNDIYRRFFVSYCVGGEGAVYGLLFYIADSLRGCRTERVGAETFCRFKTLIDREKKICYSLLDIQKREGSRAETYLEASFLLRQEPKIVKRMRHVGVP